MLTESPTITDMPSKVQTDEAIFINKIGLKELIRSKDGELSQEQQAKVNDIRLSLSKDESKLAGLQQLTAFMLELAGSDSDGITGDEAELINKKLDVLKEELKIEKSQIMDEARNNIDGVILDNLADSCVRFMQEGLTYDEAELKSRINKPFLRFYDGIGDAGNIDVTDSGFFGNKAVIDHRALALLIGPEPMEKIKRKKGMNFVDSDAWKEWRGKAENVVDMLNVKIKDKLENSMGKINIINEPNMAKISDFGTRSINEQELGKESLADNVIKNLENWLKNGTTVVYNSKHGRSIEGTISEFNNDTISIKDRSNKTNILLMSEAARIKELSGKV